MTMTLRNIAMTSVIALGLGAGSAMASCHGDWDTNQDSMYDQNEFNSAYGDNAWFGEADMDDDGFLSEDEHRTGLFGSYDSNGDGLFYEEERKVGYVWSDDYGIWDTDGAVGLTEFEFGTGLGEEGIYEASDTDRDGLMSENEFGTGLYGGYDWDKSGYLEDEEVAASCDDYGEEGFWDV
jgi:hypothetical protein